jgi:hypothetical protein
MNDLADSPAARSWEPPTTKLTKLIAAPAVEFCKETDVLLVFRASVRSKVFQETIEEWADAYIQAPMRQKAPVIEAVRYLLEKSGCRFIKQDLAVQTATGHPLVQEQNKTTIRNKIVASLRSEQRRRREAASPNDDDAKLCKDKRKRRKDASPNYDDAKICKGKRKRKTYLSPNDDNAKICKGKAAASMPPSPLEPPLALVPGPFHGLASSDTLAWIQYYIEKDPAPTSSKDTVNDDDADICKEKAAATTPQLPEPTLALVPGPPQSLTSSDTLAWIQQCIENDFAPALSKDTVHDDDGDAKSCKGEAAALMSQIPQKPTVNHVPGPPQSLTSSDTLAWIEQYLEKDPFPALPKEVLLQETLISEPWLFATATTTPVAQTMPTSTFAQLPVQGETTARQQLFQDPLQDLQSKRMATATTTVTAAPMACNNYNSDYEWSQEAANTTAGLDSLPFSSTTQEAAVVAADQTMTDAHPQEQGQEPQHQPEQYHDDGGGGTTHAAAHASGPTGTDSALQVYLDRMKYLEQRVLFLRESNDSLLGRIVKIEKQTYW